MPNPKNYISMTAAVETLERFFKDDGGSGRLLLEELYKAAGRQDIDEQTNRNWFNNKYTQLKYHGLVKTLQEFDRNSRRHKTVGIQLTMAGKEALRRAATVTSTDEVHQPTSQLPASNVSINDLATAVKVFQDTHPEFEIVFDVKFRGVVQAK